MLPGLGGHLHSAQHAGDLLAALLGRQAARGRSRASLGGGFLDRATEAAQCHRFGNYHACCAMAGAAAESILIAVAITKVRDEQLVLKAYRAAQGRKHVTDMIVGGATAATAEQFRNATNLLNYWRDAAAHGQRTAISEIEAHEALGRLIRFAQFVTDNWDALTTPSS